MFKHLRLVFLLLPLFAHAEGTDTLEKIRGSGTIAIGFRDSSIPVSYLAGNGKPAGFAVDLCLKVVDEIRARYSLPDLQVRYTTTTAQNRIPLVVNGTIDIECGSTTNTVARQQQVAFSLTYFVASVTGAVKKSSGINSLADLNGKTVVASTGTTAIPLMRAFKKTENVQVSEIYGRDNAESFLLVQSDRAAAFVIDDIILVGAIANATNPGDFKILPDVLRKEPYGIMFRKDDPKFKKLVDDVFLKLMKSGEIQALYGKWFTQPIPPNNINLNYPMSEAVKDAYQNPSDKGI